LIACDRPITFDRIGDYALQDTQYNVIGLVDDTGDLIERYAYDRYGKRTVYQPVDGTDSWCLAPGKYSARVQVSGQSQTYGLCEVGFQGLWHDEELDIVDNRARIYIPSLGRFAQTDPIGYPDGLNPYAAYHVMWGGVDPWGLSTDCLCPYELRRKCRALRRLLRFDSADIRNHLEQLGLYSELASEIQTSLYEAQLAMALGDVFSGAGLAKSGGKLARLLKEYKQLAKSARTDRMVGLNGRAADKLTRLESEIKAEAAKSGVDVAHFLGAAATSVVGRTSAASHQNKTMDWAKDINEHLGTLIEDARNRLRKNTKLYDDLDCFKCE